MDENKALEKKDETQNIPVPVIEKEKKDKLDFQEQITGLIPTAGTIDLTANQRDILYSPVKEEDVEIRPDGLIYLPWMEYVSRLTGAFPGQWAIIPQGMPTMKNDYILWPFWLVIQGKIAGFAVGEQQYHANNPQMTYGDAIEGAKSNALMRLCKGIGISLELWKPSFIRTWKEKYAEEYYDESKKKKLWRKKNNNKKVPGEPKSESGKSEPPLQSQINFLEEMAKYKVKVGKIKYDEILTGRYSCMKPDEVKPEDQASILKEMEEAYQKRTEKK